MNYFYGPVPSRRLGFSLGVDLIPKKVCSFDCLYCQLVKTTKKIITRFTYVDEVGFKKELKEIIKKNPKIDYITLSGSGEPTLHKNLNRIILAIKKITKTRFPVCVITNSSLLYRKNVRSELKQADLIIPSLDAATRKTFNRINRPHKSLSFKKIIDGLVSLRKEFKGEIWLEVMLVGGINDSLEEAEKFKKIIQKIKPNKIQLNLPVRPSETKISLPCPKRIKTIEKIITGSRKVALSFCRKQRKTSLDTKGEILKYLTRRPAGLSDLVNSLGMNSQQAVKFLKDLLKERVIKQYIYKRKKYFVIKALLYNNTSA